jgi:hypothetical protein
MNVFLKYVLGILTGIALITVAWILDKRPNTEKIEEQTFDWYGESSFPNPDNYDSLVQVDEQHNKTFLRNVAISSELINNQFPYSTIKFDTRETLRVLKILNDSSSYQWGELGTPYHDKTLIYYDKMHNSIGFTLIDYGGEVDNYPFLPLMKWGAMTQNGFNQLLSELNKK